MRRPKESEVKFDMVRDVKREGGYGRRIEDRFSVGMPDLILIPVRCRVVWVEVKIIEGNILSCQGRQYIELKRLTIPPHSAAFLVGWKSGLLFAAPPIDSIHIDDCIKQKPDETIPAFIRRCIDVQHLLEGANEKTTA
jgi:hypothetical protein